MRDEKNIPFSFVFDELEKLQPIVRPMFGCFAVYVDIKIMLILRNRKDHTDDNGVWIATAPEHHESLKMLLPSMRPIKVLGKISKWQNIPVDSEDFEESVMKVCELILKRDARIGAVPKSRLKKSKKPVTKKSAKKISKPAKKSSKRPVKRSNKKS